MACLFEPLRLRGLTLRNRIVMAPMSQKSADTAGCATVWHQVHYGSRAVGGVGLILMEDTAVTPAGRLDERALGLYDDPQVAPLREIVDFCHTMGAAVGIQLSHSGRKAFASAQGRGAESIVGPSPLPFADGWATPRPLEEAELETIVAEFVAAARRAQAAGFDLVEIHAAHGYLLHEFLSPLTNQRRDAYGGALENRARLLLRVLDEVRAAWPTERPVFVRISATDLEPGGLELPDMISLSSTLQAHGADMIDVSAGGLTASPVGAHTADQPAMAARIRREAGVRTIAVGSVTSPATAEQLLQDGAGDLVAIGRLLLRNPYWAFEAARDLGADVAWPGQYAMAKGG